jgi:60 kDa SS-A/Ro ribonucleoprotein
MVMATVRAEDQVQVWGFCHKMVPLAITKRTSVDQAVEIVSRADFGNTDCALPMLEAVRQKVEADAFVIYTDNETWVGDVHPVQALAEYRRRVVPRAKLVANAFTASHSSIADPNDGGMVDMIGLDSATPRLIADFVTDKI